MVVGEEDLPVGPDFLVDRAAVVDPDPLPLFLEGLEINQDLLVPQKELMVAMEVLTNLVIEMVVVVVAPAEPEKMDQQIEVVMVD